MPVQKRMLMHQRRFNCLFIVFPQLLARFYFCYKSEITVCLVAFCYAIYFFDKTASVANVIVGITAGGIP